MSLKMSKDEREEFLAGLHVGIMGIGREGRGPLTVPIWYDYEPGGDAWVMTNANSLKGKALKGVERISLCAQTKSPTLSIRIGGRDLYDPAFDARSAFAYGYSVSG